MMHVKPFDQVEALIAPSQAVERGSPGPSIFSGFMQLVWAWMGVTSQQSGLMLQP